MPPDIFQSNEEPKPTAPPTEQQPESTNDNAKLLSTFSFTYDANISDYDELESDHEDEGYDHITRGFMKDHCLRNGEARYAIKRIKSTLVGEEEITNAAIDLARGKIRAEGGFV